jgi:hypothetical protein
MEIINKQISPEASAKVEIIAGKIQLSAVVDTGGVDGMISIAVDGEYFIDELSKKIPGTLDDAILAVLKSAIKAL